MDVKKLVPRFADFVLALCASVGLVLLVTVPLTYKPSLADALITNFIVLAALVLTLRSRRTALASGAALLAALLLYAAKLILGGELAQAVQSVTDFFLWIDNSTKMLETPNALYGGIVSGVLSFVLCLVTYLFMYRRPLAWPVVLFGVAAASLVYTSGYSFHPGLIYLLFCAIAFSVLHKVYRRRAAATAAQPGLRRFFVSAGELVLLSLLLMTVGSSFHTEVESEFWQDLYNRAYYAVKEPITNTSEYVSHSLDKLGFGSRQEDLGGKVDNPDREVLQVTTDLTDRPLYLTGTVFDRYSGNKWYTVSKPQQKLRESTVLNAENSEALYLADGAAEPPGFIRRASTTVTFMRLRTKTVYTASGLREISVNSPKVPVFYLTPLGSARTYDFWSEGFSYTLTHNDIRQNAASRRVLSLSRAGIYSEDVAAVDRMLSLAGLAPREGQYYLDGAAYAGWVRETYLTLPKSLSPEAGDLARRIAEAAGGSDYDKAKAVESYLANMFAYDLEVEKFPENSDFVSYFLFQAKRGYCTHFASAAVLMLRSIGIPTRYVEGFTYNPDDARKTADGRITFVLKAENAHSWAEAYFEGAGWVRIDATPGWSNAELDPFIPLGDEPMPETVATETEPVETTTQSGQMQSEQTQAGESEMTGESKPEETQPEEPQTEEPQTEEGTDEGEQGPGGAFGAALFWILLLLLFIAAVVLGNLARVRMQAKRVRAAAVRERILRQFGYYLRVLRFLGFPRAAGETAIEFARRVDEHITFFGVSFEQAAEAFSAARYGNAPLSDRDAEIVMRFDPEFSAMLKRRMHPALHFVLTYILPWLQYYP